VREQKLIDIMYEVGLTIADSKELQEMSKEDLAEWISGQLRLCGFDVIPVGMCWGYLRNV
jgi:hypothetical protein